MSRNACFPQKSPLKKKMCLKGMLFFQVDGESKEVAMQTNCYHLFIYLFFYTKFRAPERGVHVLSTPPVHTRSP